MSRPDGAFDRRLLAELDAGLLDPARAARVRAAASADPAAAAVLAALGATRADLAGMPVPPVPPGAAERWAAVAQAAGPGDPGSGDPGQPPTGPRAPGPDPPGPQPRDGKATGPHPRRPTEGERPPVEHAPAPHIELVPTGDPPPAHVEVVRGEPCSGTARPSRARFPRARPALVAAGLLAVLVAGGLVAQGADPARIERIDLAAIGRSTVGETDLGPLADPARRAGCLRAVRPPEVDAATPVLGGRRVELEGRPGILLVFPADRRGVFRIVVVDPDCGPGGGTLLGAAVVGE